MKYYTLVMFDINESKNWIIEFGDYDKEVVKEEMEDYFEQGILKKHMKIICTDEDQESINQNVAKLNEKQVKGKTKKYIVLDEAGNELMVCPIRTLLMVFKFGKESKRRILSETENGGECKLHFNGRPTVFGLELKFIIVKLNGGK